MHYCIYEYVYTIMSMLTIRLYVIVYAIMSMLTIRIYDIKLPKYNVNVDNTYMRMSMLTNCLTIQTIRGLPP